MPSFLKKKKRGGVDFDGRGGGEDLGGIKEGSSQNILYEKKYFSKRKIKQQNTMTLAEMK